MTLCWWGWVQYKLTQWLKTNFKTTYSSFQPSVHQTPKTLGKGMPPALASIFHFIFYFGIVFIWLWMRVLCAVIQCWDDSTNICCISHTIMWRTTIGSRGEECTKTKKRIMLSIKPFHTLHSGNLNTQTFILEI